MLPISSSASPLSSSSLLLIDATQTTTSSGFKELVKFSASTVNLHGASNSNMFRNNLQIRLSPLKSPILRKYINPFKRPGMYPSISKCNAKKCNCCNHLCSKGLSPPVTLCY